MRWSLLGAFHGINPGMGWLFAVALGMQQGSARGVWRALPPIALGHAAAVGVVVAARRGRRSVVVPLDGAEGRRRGDADHARVLPAVAASAPAVRRDAGRLSRSDDLVVSDGVRARRGLHGAAVRDGGAGDCGGGQRGARGPHDGDGAGAAWVSLWAVGVHTLAYLIVMTLAAWVVYRKLGLAFLRTAWFNLDWLWAGALVITRRCGAASISRSRAAGRHRT